MAFFHLSDPHPVSACFNSAIGEDGAVHSRQPLVCWLSHGRALKLRLDCERAASLGFLEPKNERPCI